MTSKPAGLAKSLGSLVQILRGKPRLPASLQDNPLLQLILNRRSVRRFFDQDIPEDHFAAILEAGRLAPSTVNLQTWSFAIFKRDQWQALFGRSIPLHGQRAVIVIGDTYRTRQVLDVFPYSPLVEYTIAVINASLAAMAMNLAAEALGVSSVMLSETGRTGLLDANYLKDKLGLPENTFPLMTIVLGYARGPRPVMPPKLPAEQIFFEGKYCQPSPKVMEAWLSQMQVGYKASHLRSSFESQLEIYRRKIGQTEADLHDMVFYQKGT